MTKFVLSTIFKKQHPLTVAHTRLRNLVFKISKSSTSSQQQVLCLCTKRAVDFSPIVLINSVQQLKLLKIPALSDIFSLALLSFSTSCLTKGYLPWILYESTCLECVHYVKYKPSTYRWSDWIYYQKFKFTMRILKISRLFKSFYFLDWN